MSDTEKRTRRFLGRLVRAGRAERTKKGDGFHVSGGAEAEISELGIRELEAHGLVRLDNDLCFPTRESTAWLRRHLSATGDFAGQHRQIVPGPEGSVRDLGADVLEKLARSGCGFLQPHHLAAGRRVCQWGRRAQLNQRVTMSYDPSRIGGKRNATTEADIADMAAEARKSLARLFTDLPRDCAEIILDVCVFEKGLQVIERERGWPRRSAKLVLRIGLDQLAERLGLSPRANGRPTGRMTTWSGADFQPTRFE